MDYELELKRRILEAEEAVVKWLPDDNAEFGCMIKAMRYSVLAGGKRVRPVLMKAVYDIYAEKQGDISPFAAAMEYIHTASLVHDDLPAIDNDTLRRGQPTTHSKFGEAIGILAGDALLNHAFEVLLNGALLSEEKTSALKAASIIANKSGCQGMLGGQDADVEAEKSFIDNDDISLIEYVYENKTSALIEASLMAGAAFAGADENELKRLEKIGSCIGKAFQIQDDILDVTSSAELLGKNIMSDIKNGKATYLSIKGMEASRKAVDEETAKAAALIDEINGDTEFLKEFALRLAHREK